MKAQAMGSRANRLKFFVSRGVPILAAVVLAGGLLWSQPAHAVVAIRAASSGNNAGGAASLSLSMPTGVVVGDVMIALVSIRGGTGTTVTAPSGWTLVDSRDNGTSVKSAVYSKVAASGEAGPYAFGLSGTLKASGVISAYSGVDTAQPVDVVGSQTNASTPMLTPTLTTTEANTMLVAAYSSAIGTTFAPGSGMTLRGQSASTGAGAASRTTSGLQDVLQAAVGATGQKSMTASTGAVGVGHLMALRPAPSLTQVNYRFFQNTDSAAASSPLAASGVGASIGVDTPLRLRLNLGVDSGSTKMTNVTTRAYTLQYALRGSDGVCDTAFATETYADVTSSTTVRFYDNPTPADGAAYATNANDPTRSGITAVGQKYEEINPFLVGTAVPANQDALWDISLTTSGATVGQVYCFRVVDSFGMALSTYTSIPQMSLVNPTITQANYRWFANADSATPGPALATQDTATTIAPGATLRLRQRLAVDTAPLGQSKGSYKLQYAEKSGTCDVGFSGESYQDFSMLQSQTKSATNVISDSSSGGSAAWVSASNAAVADGANASAKGTSLGGVSSEFAKSSAHGFSLPANAIVTGIVAGATTSASTAPGGYVGVGSVYIVKGGVVGAQNMDSTIMGSWTDGSPSWGGTTNLWGESWTANDINNGNFGFVVSVGVSGDGTNPSYAYLDGMTLTVYYTVPSGDLQYSDNPTPPHGATISSVAGDPTSGSRSTVYQNYLENDPFTNSIASIAAGSDGLWDASLTATSAAAGKTYCVRVVNANNSLLNAYSVIPELLVSSVANPLDQQLRGGQSVTSGVKNPFTW